jgi:predicted NAD/FAD-dependent oxidoreductase
MIDIAIIGAGIAALSLAHQLTQHMGERVRITLFEKARGVSGRMSTRYHNVHMFDHGAQYFTARSPEFQAFLAPFIAEGTVQEWQPRVLTLTPDAPPYKRDWFEPHYVASPRMNSLCAALASTQQVKVNTEIAHLMKQDDRWLLHDKNGGVHEADWVISTAPAPQTAALVAPLGLWQDEWRAVEMLPCITLMVGLHTPLSLPFDAAKVKSSALDWIACNHSKPNRADTPCLIAHSTAAWAAEHIEQDPAHLHILLLEALQRFIPLTQENIAYITAHRWRYADVGTPCTSPFLLDSGRHIAACGDWGVAGKVEGAFLSSHRLLHALLPHLYQ